MFPEPPRRSHRFKASGVSRWLIPVFLGILTLGLLLTLAIVIGSVTGLTPNP
ncbi:hypothetical protein [Anaerolinea thermolimosa]|uniref:hypothetical protein n=1 Tax=Anaerolinea thermolimosa TaxID=229919 RepID=UPI0013B45B0D|nr:hypothetical protein [Anaerolinea thermolimosa]